MRITLYITKLAIVLCGMLSFAQNDSIPNTKAQDSVKFKERYGLRVGLDLSKPVRSLLDDEYTGFEIVADYRLTKKWYLAAELGNEKKQTTTDFLNVSSKGSYIKAGGDYNFYNNWFGMENMMYSGLRVGFSTFSQTRESYTTYNTSQYWLPQFTSNTPQEFSGLSAIWAEVQFGIKAEVLKNVYVGINAQLKYLVSDDKPNNFENLFIPGYNKTYDSGAFGFGYGYNISYLIPLYKKAK